MIITLNNFYNVERLGYGGTGTDIAMDKMRKCLPANPLPPIRPPINTQYYYKYYNLICHNNYIPYSKPEFGNKTLN